MNKVAQDLGAVKTRFSNPHGLDATHGFVHESTAADIGRIAAVAMRCRLFQRISSSSRHTAPVWRATAAAATACAVTAGSTSGTPAAGSTADVRSGAAQVHVGEDGGDGAGAHSGVGDAGPADGGTLSAGGAVSGSDTGGTRHGRAAEKLIGKVQKQRAVHNATDELSARGFAKTHVRLRSCLYPRR